MARKFNLIFLSALLLTLVFGTTSYAKTLITDTPKFVMTELLEYARDVQDELRSNYDLELREALINEMISNTNIDTLWHEFLNYYIGEKPNYLDQLVCMINLDYLDNELNLIFIPVKENATDSENYTLNLNETQINTGFTTQVRTVDSSLALINTRAFKLTIKNTGAISTGNNGTSSLSINNLNQLVVEENSDILNFPGIIGFNKEPYARVKLIQNASYTYYNLKDYISAEPSGGSGEEDNPPSGGGGGVEDNPPSSGDTVGAINNKLDNISGELSNINNNLTTVPDISDTTISSEDITNNLNFEFMEDPYSNFWLDLTTGLSGALTNDVRVLDINWLGHIHTINLDNIGLKYPPSMELILKSTSTVAMVWVLVKWWKIITDKLASGNMDDVLAMNEEERHY